MTATSFFFGFDGRVGRTRFWIFGLIVYTLAALAMAFDPILLAVISGLTAIPIVMVLLLYLFLGMSSVAVIVLGIAIDTVAMREMPPGLDLAVLLGSAALGIALSWIVVAVASKRLHDRDKSGWWLLLFVLTPLLLGGAGAVTHSDALLAMAFAVHVWSFVELGCRRGTAGGNRFGPDPLAAGEET